MADPATPDTSVGDVFAKTVVLAFDLAGTEIVDSQDLFDKSMADPSVQTALKQVLSGFALQNAGKTQFSEDDAKKLGQALLDQAKGKLPDAVLKQIKLTPEYKALEKSLTDLQNTFKASPSGMWVDRNKNILYVAAIVLGVGGAALLYIKKTDNTVVNFGLGKLDGVAVDVVKVGGVKLGVKLLQYRSATRTVGGAVTAKTTIGTTNVSFEAGMTVVGPKVDQIKGQVVVQTHEGVKLTVDGTDTLSKNKLDFGLGIEIPGGSLPGPVNLRLGAGITDDKFTQASLTAGMTTKVGDFGIKGSTDGKQWSTMATFSLSFN